MNDMSRQEVEARIATSEAKVDARLANFDTSLKTGFAELRADMSKMQGDLIKWMVATMFAFGLLIIGVLTLVVNSAVNKSPEIRLQQPASQAPSWVLPPGTVIQVPPSPTAPLPQPKPQP